MNPEQFEPLMAFVTCGNREEAQKLARLLVSRKLAACVNILDRIESVYEWQGQLNNDSEYLLLIKTDKAHFTPLKQLVSENHSYDCPEVIGVNISCGDESYLNWMKQTLSQNR